MTDENTRERILRRLKLDGAATTAELARHLGISVPAVRQHLKNLSDAGWIVKSELRGGVGRPAQQWALTAAGHGQFPDGHAETTAALIASVRATLGEAALDAVIADRYQRTHERYAAAIEADAGLEERLHTLLRLREEEGYMPELVQEDGGWLFVENHCPICRAAEACQGFCRNELDVFRAVLGTNATVERVEYLITGDRRCAYRVIE